MGAGQTIYTLSKDDEREKDTLKATVTWPFYSGGKNYANLNKNKSLELQKNLLLENMTKKITISSGESNLLSPLKHIRFWEKGEMAYSALRKINELKANNELKNAEIMLDEWFF